MRIDEAGHVATDEDYIYYDSNYNGQYDTNDGRGASYDPDDWNPGISSVSQNSEGRYYLPFEKIETVNAVIVFSARNFRLSGKSYSDVSWFLENGQAVNFSPMSGLSITQE